jgi:hypothetical protein
LNEWARWCFGAVLTETHIRSDIRLKGDGVPFQHLMDKKAG